MVSPGLQKNLLSIWDRTKKNINVSQLRFGSEADMAQQLKQIMEDSGVNRAAVNNLIKSGFHEAAVRNSVITNEFVRIEPKIIKPSIVKAPRILQGKKLALGQPYGLFDGKIKIRSKGTIRTLNSDNVKITIGKYGAKDAFYISNIKTGKRITFGILKEAKT